MKKKKILAGRGEFLIVPVGVRFQLVCDANIRSYNNATVPQHG